MKNGRVLLVWGFVITLILALMPGFSFHAQTGGKGVSFIIQANDSQVMVNLSGIDSLANGFHYEGWAIVNGAPVTTGKFNVNNASELVDLAGNTIAGNTFMVTQDLASAAAIVITIEPAGDVDEIPAATKYLGGDVSNGSATLSPAHGSSLGSDFSSATGTFILATPTDGAGTNENSGIWFLELVSNTLTLAFENLTTLDNGFHYEGWTIIDGAPFSTGKFNVDGNGDLVDLMGNVITDGKFVTSLDLSQASDFVLTIEPDGDTDALPAGTKYLAGNLDNGVADLDVNHPATLADDFSAAAGKYILATPTNGAATDENSGIWFLDPGNNALELSVADFDPLTDGFHYEGWAIVGGAPVTTGKFNIDGSGQIVDLDGNLVPHGRFPVPTDISTASDIVITIEPDGDVDTVPAATKFLGGSVVDNETNLSVAHGSSLGDDFSSATGKYILATPTNGANTNENSGIWFLDNSSGSPVAGLSLPVLPAGWNYEGWVVFNGTPVTTGTFTSVDVADDAAPFSGAIAGPPFPGEDFLMNAPSGLTFPDDLAGKTAVISIEPSPDNSTAPFTLKPLVGAIPSDATDHTVYEMSNEAGGFPTASAKIVRPVAGLALPNLPAGWKYEGWVVIDGTPVTTGLFVDPVGADESAPFSGSEAGPPYPGEDFLANAPEGLTFPVDLAGRTAVISVEPSPDDSPAPFALKPLVGEIPGNAVDHTVYNMDNNSGSFPNGTATVSASPTAGLGLPDLPSGWKYEGWVVINGIPVTTGTFTSLNSIDDSAPFSGTEGGPPFPGEDFLQNAPEGLSFPTDLSGTTAVISIEPFPDDSPSPFTLKPLVSMIPDPATDHTNYTMTNNAENFPSGSAEIQTTTAVEPGGLSSVPKEITLRQNYPNPFNPSTVISFDVTEKRHVTLKIFNLVGEEVTTLVNEDLNAGYHKRIFEAARLPAGVYMYRLTIGNYQETRKMILLK